jgi:hypothetical protein
MHRIGRLTTGAPFVRAALIDIWHRTTSQLIE